MKKWLRKNRHARWALALFYILLMYYLPEKYITGSYTPTQTALDAWIPFCAPCIIPYLLWFPGLALTGLWLLLKDGAGFRRYMLYLVFAYSTAALVYTVFPNGQDLRPDLSGAEGFFEKLTAFVYSADTNTNVCPSLHVIGGMSVMFAVRGSKRAGQWMKLSAVLFFIIVSASTVFVKQHAVLDVAAGLAVGVFLYFFVFRLILPDEPREECGKP